MKAKPLQKQTGQKGNSKKFLLASLLLFLATVLTFSVFSSAPFFKEAKGGYSCKHKSKKREQALNQLPKNKRGLFKAMMDKVWKDNDTLREQKKSLYREIKGILSADNFDEKAMTQKFEEIQALKHKMKQNHHQAIVSFAKKLNKKERTTLANVMHFGKHGCSLCKHGKGGCPYHRDDGDEN